MTQEKIDKINEAFVKALQRTKKTMEEMRHAFIVAGQIANEYHEIMEMLNDFQAKAKAD